MSFKDHPLNILNTSGAPEFVNTDAQALLKLAISNFEVETGRVLSPSQVEMYLLETVAYMLAVRGAEEQLAIQDGYVAYAQSARLDLIGAERNTPRLLASPATTTARFIRADNTVTRIRIPQGTRIGEAGGLVQFGTLAVAYIEVGQASVEVDVQATEVGIGGNSFAAGEISSIIDPVPGIASVTNLTATGGGADVEGDPRYRVRLALAFEGIGNGLSQERYVSDVLAWNARCIDVAVTRPQPGYVNIYPLMDTGAANAQELASLGAVFNGSNTHQGDFIQVFAPTSHDFSFELVLTVSDPDAASRAEDAVHAELNTWEAQLGGYIAPSELVRAARAIAGVLDADVPDLSFAVVSETAWRNCTGFVVTVVNV